MIWHFRVRKQETPRAINVCYIWGQDPIRGRFIVHRGQAVKKPLHIRILPSTSSCSDSLYQMDFAAPKLGSLGCLYYVGESATVCVRVCVCVCWLFSSPKGPQRLICLNHDGQDPSGFPRLLLIPSHQHEMLIVRQSGSRRLVWFVRSLQASIFRLGFWGFGFPNDSPAVLFLFDQKKNILLGCRCVLYISVSHLWCSEPDTSSAKYHCANPWGKANTQRDKKKGTYNTNNPRWM